MPKGRSSTGGRPLILSSSTHLTHPWKVISTNAWAKVTVSFEMSIDADAARLLVWRAEAAHRRARTGVSAWYESGAVTSDSVAA
jgi:hypothetical protein